MQSGTHRKQDDVSLAYQWLCNMLLLCLLLLLCLPCFAEWLTIWELALESRYNFVVSTLLWGVWVFLYTFVQFLYNYVCLYLPISLHRMKWHIWKLDYSLTWPHPSVSDGDWLLPFPPYKYWKFWKHWLTKTQLYDDEKLQNRDFGTFSDIFLNLVPTDYSYPDSNLPPNLSHPILPPKYLLKG